MDQTEFLTDWVGQADAAPLILTGPKAAVDETVVKLRSFFSLADIHTMAAAEKTITIKDVRVMRAVFNQRAWSGQRLIIIPEAEKLSLPAASALLKMLEEATRTSRFVLTTTWYRRLLPTIRSRGVRLSVGRTTKAAEVQEAPLPASLGPRLAQFAGDTPLSGSTLEQINRLLEDRLRREGPSPALAAAYLRLRDYHRIVADPGGNYKLARDVLLASL